MITPLTMAAMAVTTARPMAALNEPGRDGEAVVDASVTTDTCVLLLGT